MNSTLKLFAIALLALCAPPGGADQAVPATGPQAAKAAPTPKPASPHPLRNVFPGDAYAYFSGNAQSQHNHPAMYAYQGETRMLVVIGRGYRQEFPVSSHAEAFKAYLALLRNTGYRVDDPGNGRSPFAPPSK